MQLLRQEKILPETMSCAIRRHCILSVIAAKASSQSEDIPMYELPHQKLHVAWFKGHLRNANAHANPLHDSNTTEHQILLISDDYYK